VNLKNTIELKKKKTKKIKQLEIKKESINQTKPRIRLCASRNPQEEHSI
jgi:hypothetical protein